MGRCRSWTRLLNLFSTEIEPRFSFLVNDYDSLETLLIDRRTDLDYAAVNFTTYLTFMLEHSDPTSPALPSGPITIAVIDDEIVTVRRLTHILKRAGFETRAYTSGLDFMDNFHRQPPEVVIMDVHLADADGVDLMLRLRLASPHTEVILITGYASIGHAVDATKKGAFQYLAKPFKIEELLAAVNEAVRKVEESRQVERTSALQEVDRPEGMIGNASKPSAMYEIFRTIRRVAPVDCNVLILGESGTGKELVARALHQQSPRRGKPFVSFNCGAFTADLIANELFGHEKGAFTGAAAAKLGLLETASGGTVFLDEVGEMPLPMQIKLLRVLQEYCFLRVGGVKPIEIDVRFIAATNRDIDKMVQSGEFRQDFYYRLKVVTIELPPLRSRREDIPALASHFAEKSAKRYGKPVQELSPGFLEPLLAYPFPGNVRELEHIIERAVALSNRSVLERQDLPPDMFIAAPNTVSLVDESCFLKDLERGHILDVYRATGFNQVQTAKVLGISRTTLWRRLHEFNLLPATPTKSS
jgi:DNA-binding NtrC family response regulator